jgi:hypothetical protein
MAYIALGAKIRRELFAGFLQALDIQRSRSHRIAHHALNRNNSTIRPVTPNVKSKM